MTIGSQPITVTSLGRFCVAVGNVGTHEVRVIRVSDNTVVASANVSMSGCTVGQFKYAALGTAVTLSASTAYLVVSYEVGSDTFHNWVNTVLTTTAVATVNHGIYTTDGGQTWGPAGSTGNSYVPVSLMYTSGSVAIIKWLVADQLGTPRMVFDKSGSLANTKRHDYLAFGEEWFAGMGGRTTGEGYVADGVRQKFTLKERDIETGLDYFGARYYASTQGRFTSPDAPFADQFQQNPQSWNLYSYTRNNPVRAADKDGRITPWDILDIISLVMSVRDFWRQPSLANAGWVAADAIGAALPLIPLGSIRRATQLAKMLDKAASVKNLENATELGAFSKLSREGMVLATGQDNVRQAVGMTTKGPVADLITLTKENKFIISEVKEVKDLATGTADVGHAIEQLTNTAENLVKNVSGAEISRLEIVVNAGTNLGPNYKRSGDQLLRLNNATNKWEPVRILNKVVHVTELLPGPVPSSLR